MQKKVLIFVEKEGKERVYRLFEMVAGEFIPAADEQIRKGVIDRSSDLSVIANSVLRINEVTSDSVAVEFKLPESFDSKKYEGLGSVEKLFVREKLGLSPG